MVDCLSLLQLQLQFLGRRGQRHSRVQLGVMRVWNAALRGNQSRPSGDAGDARWNGGSFIHDTSND